jgi:hypothetical protein
MWCSKIKNNHNNGLPNHWNLEGWKFEDAIWMHRTRHNVKVGNKKKQEKAQKNVYLATNLVFQPLFAHCILLTPPPPFSKQSAQLHTNGIKIRFNITFEIKSQHLTKKIKLHGLSYPNRWVGVCKSKGLNCFYNTNERGHHTRKWMIETQRMSLLGIIPTLEFWQLWTTPYSSSWL